MPRNDLDLDDFLPYRLSVAANAVSGVIARSYETLFDLKPPEWRVVAVLAQEGELSQQGIVGRTNMDKVSVSRAAQALAERGLVVRNPDPQDARSLRLSLTAEGERLHRRLAPTALELEARILEGLDAGEVASLKAMLRRIQAAAEGILAE
jgi:DNA-binding MarR family transcriptional regulator